MTCLNKSPPFLKSRQLGMAGLRHASDFKPGGTMDEIGFYMLASIERGIKYFAQFLIRTASPL